MTKRELASAVERFFEKYPSIKRVIKGAFRKSGLFERARRWLFGVDSKRVVCDMQKRVCRWIERAKR